MGLQVVTTPVPRPVRRRRRAIAIVAVAVAFLASLVYWLGATDSTSFTITPPPGTPDSGQIATVDTMSSSVTRTNGAAQLQTGIAIAKMTLGKTMTNAIRVDVAWTNAVDGARVLNNPNAQISIGIYHTIHTGDCIAASNDVDAPLVDVTDTDSKTYCAALDKTSTGRFVSATGKLLLASDQIGGYLVPTLDGSGSLNACETASDDTGGWCQPASITDSNQRTLFVIASIVTPGGIPQGQQPQLTSLHFYTDVSRNG